MASQTDTTLKGYFNTGDFPTESNFGDLIDSAILKTRSDTGTSGTGVVDSRLVTVTPSAASTRQVFGLDVNMVYNANQNVNSGGYINSIRSVINLTSTTNIDKLVVTEARYIPSHIGTVGAALAYEAVIPSVGVDADTTVFAGYYLANLQGIANIGNIQQLYSLRSEDAVARLLHRGRIFGRYGYDDSMASGEIAPPPHPGVAASRYYSGMGVVGVSNVASFGANILHPCLVHVPSEQTFNRIGLSITTGAAGNARLGIYRCANGIPTDLILDAGTVDVTSTGEKEVTISVTLPAGVYALAFVANSAPTLVWHTDYSAATVIGGNSATGFDTLMLASHTYGALPSSYPAVVYTGNGGAFPRIWLRNV